MVSCDSFSVYYCPIILLHFQHLPMLFESSNLPADASEFYFPSSSFSGGLSRATTSGAAAGRELHSVLDLHNTLLHAYSAAVMPYNGSTVLPTYWGTLPLFSFFFSQQQQQLQAKK